MVVCVPRESESELEVDGLAADILNRHQLALGKYDQLIFYLNFDCISLSQGSGGFPGLAAIWEEERERRRQLGLSSSLDPPLSPGTVHTTWGGGH